VGSNTTLKIVFLLTCPSSPFDNEIGKKKQGAGNRSREQEQGTGCQEQGTGCQEQDASSRMPVAGCQ